MKDIKRTSGTNRIKKIDTFDPLSLFHTYSFSVTNPFFLPHTQRWETLSWICVEGWCVVKVLVLTCACFQHTDFYLDEQLYQRVNTMVISRLINRFKYDFGNKFFWKNNITIRLRSHFPYVTMCHLLANLPLHLPNCAPISPQRENISW